MKYSDEELKFIYNSIIDAKMNKLFSKIGYTKECCELCGATPPEYNHNNFCPVLADTDSIQTLEEILAKHHDNSIEICEKECKNKLAELQQEINKLKEMLEPINLVNMIGHELQHLKRKNSTWNKVSEAMEKTLKNISIESTQERFESSGLDDLDKYCKREEVKEAFKGMTVDEIYRELYNLFYKKEKFDK